MRQSKIVLLELIAFSFVVFVILAIARAAASPACMTQSEARATFPHSHLWWHTRERCWNATQQVTVRDTKQRRRPVPVPGPTDMKDPTILFPTLAHNDFAVGPELMARDLTNGPLILDIDDVTASKDPPEDGVWPKLDELTFAERWAAVPSNFMLASYP